MAGGNDRVMLSTLLHASRVSPGAVEADVGEDWLQGRSVFGGLQAAIGVAAMRTRVDATVPLRTLQVTFVAPVPAGPVRAEARVLRSGKSATQVEARLVDGSETLALLVGVFGVPRSSAIAHAPSRPAIAGEQRLRFPYLPGVVPAFTRHFVAHWRLGGLPYTGHASRHTSVDLELRDDGPVGEAQILALADFIPPVALSLLSQPTPGSSLTWMLELFGSDHAAQPLAGWRVDSEMVAAEAGYTSQSNRLWAPDGSLVALSRQSMVVFG
jgi:acyl-CoA thioesterase